jgi:hypothetical protein
VCEGASISISTIAGTGGAGTCTDEYSYSTDNGSNWSSWSVSSSSFNAVEGATNLYRSRRVCDGSGCDESSYNSVSWTVVIDPVSQSITKNPNVAIVCQGEDVSATFSGGSGGTGTVNDVYEYNTNAGVGAWSSYTSGTDINTSALNGTNIVQIRTRRTASGLGCNTSDWETVAWSVQNAPTAGSISADQSICSGANPAAFTSVTAGTGDGTISYRWESSLFPFSSWSTIGGATSATYNPPGALGSTTRYRRITVSTVGGVPCESVPTTHVEVTVVSPASFTTQPAANQSVCVGGTSPTLTVAATGGVPAYIYQWYSNTTNSNSGGTNLGASNGAQTATLTIPTGTASDLYYYCEVGSQPQGGCEAITSNTGRVTVAPDPTITAASSITICTGGTADLISTPGSDGAGTCSVQWQSSPDNSTWGNISGATDTFYTTPTLTATTYYRIIRSCTGSGCDNGTSNVVTVTIVPDPSITTQPTTPAPICAGGTTASISVVAADGTPSLTYQWQYYDGSNWVDAVNETPTGAVYSGATTSGSFTVSLPSQDAYVYSCLISASGNGCNSIRTDDVTVTVVASPSITTQPTNPASVCVGGPTASISLDATGGTPSLTYQWQFWNGSAWVNAVDGTPSGSAYSGATTSNSFTVANSNVGTYEYRCVVSSSGGGCNPATSNSVFVGVVEDPSITAQPVSPQSICPDGTTTSIPFTATGGTPSLTYQWQYWNGSAWVNVAFGVPSGAFYQNPTSSTIFNVSNENVGTYEYSCLVSAAGSGCDSIRTNTITVTVVENPTITVQPTANAPSPICEGGTSSNMSLTVIGGAPSINYQWQYFNGLSWVSAVDGVPTGSTYSGANTSDSFNVTHANFGSYPYRCRMTASGSQCTPVNSSEIILQVVAAPSITSQPLEPDAICVGGTSDDMVVAATGGTPSLTYQWQYWDGSSWGDVVNGTPAGATYSGAQSTTFSVSGITTDGSFDYRAEVSASGAGCDPAYSDSVTLEVILDPYFTVQPVDPASICIGGSSSSITFTAVGGTPSLNYQWQYWNGSSWADVSDGTPTGAVYSGAQTTSFSVDGITVDGSYDYRVQVTSVGNGCNPANSDTVTIVVEPNPSITTQPISPNAICEGGTTSNMSVMASGASISLSYQWQYFDGFDWVNAVNGTPTGATYSGATTNNSFNVTQVNAGTYTYSCLVTGAGDGCNPVRTSSVSVNVQPSPSITTQPTDPDDICIGGTSNDMVVTATGGAPSLNYQWQIFSGGFWVNISNGTPAGAIYSGENTTTFSVSGISSDGTYDYRAVVSSTGGGCIPETSATVSLEVEPDPSITTQPTSPDAICTGGTTTNISVVATGGTPSLNYQWQYWNGSTWVNAVNGTPIGASYNNTTASSGFNVSNSIAGSYVYSCLISSVGSDCNSIQTSNITVNVVDQPSISGQPLDNQSLCLNGTPTDLSVIATGGTPSLTYQWYDSDGAISGETSSIFTPPTTSLGTELYYVIVSASGTSCSPIQSNLSQVIISPQPVAHTISKVPDVSAICQGTNISASFAGASGGGGTVTDEYQYSTNGGSSWASYTPSSNISTSAIFGADIVQVRTRRTATGSACNNTDWNVVTWTVHEPNTAATVTEYSPSGPICPGEEVTLSTNAVAGFGSTIQWYTSSIGTGTLLGTGTSIDIYPTTDQTYYAYVSGSTCPPVEGNTGQHDVLTPEGNVILYVGNQLGLQERCVVDGWTYYSHPGDPDNFIFAVRKNGNSVTFQVDLYTHPSVISSIRTNFPQSGSYLMRKYWNMAVETGSMVDPIDIKFYYDPADLEQAKTERDIAATPYLGNGITLGPHPQWFKTEAASINGIDGFAPSLIFNSLGNQWLFNYYLLSPTQTSTDNGITYVQFDDLASLSGGTGGTTFGQNSPVLPVELISFTATATKNTIVLDWSTASEVNNDRFEINRSIDGVTFTKIGEVNGQGTTSELTNYTYEDLTATPGITYYYQLRQVDFDGTSEFSDIVSAKIQAAGFIVGELTPNPTDDLTRIRIISPYEAQTTVRIFNILGQEMYSKIENIVVGQNDIELSGLSRFPKGNYLVNINTGIDQITKKLVLVRE